MPSDKTDIGQAFFGMLVLFAFYGLLRWVFG
jgi:hypothetical protein